MRASPSCPHHPSVECQFVSCENLFLVVLCRREGEAQLVQLSVQPLPSIMVGIPALAVEVHLEQNSTVVTVGKWGFAATPIHGLRSYRRQKKLTYFGR